jgi:hypothetical protein
MFHWLPIVLSGGIAFAGLVVLYSISRASRIGRQRKARQGIILVMIGALALCLSRGSPVRAPRAVVVLFPATVPSSDLLILFSHLSAWDRVKLVRLVDRPPIGIDGEWVWAGNLPTKGHEVELGNLLRDDHTIVIERQLNPANSEESWMERIVGILNDEGRQSLAGLEGLFKNSAVIVFDGGPIWSQQTTEEIDPARLSANVKHNTQVMVYESPSAVPGGLLRLRALPEVVPAGRPIDMAGTTLLIELVGSQLRRKGETYNLTLRVNPSGSSQLAIFGPEGIIDEDPGKPEVARIKVADLAWPPSMDVVKPMLYLVEARLTIPDLTGVTRTYRSRAYLRVEEQEILFLEPSNGEGRYANSAWPFYGAANGISPASLADAFLLNKGHVNAAWTALLSHQIITTDQLLQENGLPKSSPWRTVPPEKLTEKLHSAKVLVLVEPAAEDLEFLSAQDITTDVESGLTVLVVGPPTSESAVNHRWHEWLKLDASPTTAPLTVHWTWRDQRVYLLIDQSRVAEFTDPEGGLTLQAGFAKELGKQLTERTDAVITSSREKRGNLITAGPPLANGAWMASENNSHILFHAPVGFEPPTNDDDTRGLFSSVNGTKVETLPLYLPWRLGLLTSPAIQGVVGKRFRPLDVRSHYPGTIVVLLGVDFPQPAEAAVEKWKGEVSVLPKLAGMDPNFTAGGQSVSLGDLSTMGVRVIPVLIEPNKQAKETVTRLLEACDPDSKPVLLSDLIRRARDGGALVDEPVWIGSGAGDSPEKTAARIADLIRTHDAGLISTDFGSGNPLPRARVVDPRVTNNTGTSPWLHSRLRIREAVPDLSYHMIIREPKAMSAGGVSVSKDEASIMMASYPLGAGRVIVTAFSPWSAEMWSPSVGPAQGPVVATPPPSLIAEAMGYGVGRLLDPLHLGAFCSPVAPNRLMLKEALLLDDGATLRIDGWIDQSSMGLLMPRLFDSGGTELKGSWSTSIMQRQSNLARFEFHSPTPHKAQNAVLQLAESGAGSRLPVYLDLNAWSTAGRNTKEALTLFAQGQGGSVIGSAELASGAITWTQPAGWLARIALMILTLILFSPFVKPWLAWKLWNNIRTGMPAESASPIYDVEGVLNEFGMNPGRPAARRLAGLPAGARQYESGDSLSTARPATLIAFTAVGRRIGLSAKPPVVRLRQVPSAMETVLCVDASPSMFVERYRQLNLKHAMLRSVLRILAGTVWRSGGSVVLTCTPNSDVKAELGTSERSAQEFDQFLRKCRRQNVRRRGSAAGPVLPNDLLQPGHVCIIISDALQWTRAGVRAATEAALRQGIDLRLVQIHASPDQDFVGACVSSISGAMLDRSEWLPIDVNSASESLGQAIRESALAAGARFARLDGRNRLSDMLTELIETGVVG